MRYIFCCPWQAFWRTPHKPFRQVYHYPCYPSNLPTHICFLVFMHVFEEAKATLNSLFSIFRFSAVIFRFSPISSFIQTEVPLHLRLGFFACMHCISMERYFKQFFSCVIFQTFSFIEFFFSLPLRSLKFVHEGFSCQKSLRGKCFKKLKQCFKKFLMALSLQRFFMVKPCPNEMKCDVEVGFKFITCFSFLLFFHCWNYSKSCYANAQLITDESQDLVYGRVQLYEEILFVEGHLIFFKN